MEGDGGRGLTLSPHAVVVMCMHSVLLGGEEQRVLLEKAEDMGMTDGTYVFIPYDALTFPLPYHRVPYPILANSTKLRLAYDAVLTITIDSPEVSFHEALRQAQEAYEIPAHIDPTQVLWDPRLWGGGGETLGGWGWGGEGGGGVEWRDVDGGGRGLRPMGLGGRRWEPRTGAPCPPFSPPFPPLCPPGPPAVRHHLQLHLLLGQRGGGHAALRPLGDGQQRGRERPRLPDGGLLPTLLRHRRRGRQRPLRGVGHGRQRGPLVAGLWAGTGHTRVGLPRPLGPLASQLQPWHRFGVLV